MAEKSGFSFSFSKKKESKVIKNDKITTKEDEDQEETDYVLTVEGKQVKSTITKEEKGELVIPLIHANRWRNAKRPDELDNDSEAGTKNNLKASKHQSADVSDQDEAVKELLKEAAATNDQWEERGKTKDSGMQIPLLLQNKVPEGFETDEKLNVDLRPDAAAEADYESVPIEQYGMALLRGMGFKQDQGIGKNGKAVKPIDAMPRPKGLGLGADRSLALQAKGGKHGHHKSNDDEKLEMKKGAYGLIISGKHADFYGVIEGLDEDNSRVVFKLALNGESINLSQFAVKLVPKAEYDKFSKYLNKGKADRYKEQQKEKVSSSGDESNRREKRKKHKRSRSRSKERYSKQERSRSRSPSKKSRRDRSRSREKKDRQRDRDSLNEGKNRRKEDSHKTVYPTDKSSRDLNGSAKKLWVHPHLRVRIVDEKYKKGKYFKQKVIIEDVVSMEQCICRTEEGRVLEDLNQSMLETVIPKKDRAYVMIISGKHKRQLGEVLERTKECIARVQLLSDRDTLLQIDYDNICEYTGDIHETFDY